MRFLVFLFLIVSAAVSAARHPPTTGVSEERVGGGHAHDEQHLGALPHPTRVKRSPQ